MALRYFRNCPGDARRLRGPSARVRLLPLAIDIGLMALAAASMAVFLLAYGIIRYFHPSHAFWLEIGALCRFLLSILLWLLVALVTPAPLVVKDVAMTGARLGLEKLPEEIRERIPEDLRLKISGQN